MYQSSQSDREAGPSGNVPRAGGGRNVHYASDKASSDAPLLTSDRMEPLPLPPPPRIFRQHSINQGYVESGAPRSLASRQESRAVNIDHSLRVHPIAANDWHSFSFSEIGQTGSESQRDGLGLCALLLTVISVLLIIVFLPFSLFFCVKVVQEYERAVIFRLGRLVAGGARGPGLFFIIPCIDSYCKVDLRTVSFDVPPQEILSKDSVTVSVDAVVYYRISNAVIAISNVEDYNRSTRLLAATTLRNVLGTKNLTEILSEREAISQTMRVALDDATDPWGVHVERVEVKDVRLPIQLQRAMATEAEAAREARAKVIMSEGELKSAKFLKAAGDEIASGSHAMQLRYLQTLGSIANENNSTIIFPVPINLFEAFNQARKPDAGEQSRAE